MCITSLRQAGAIFSRYFQSEVRFPSESRELSEGNHGSKIYSTDDKSNSVIKFNFIEILQLNKVTTSSPPVIFFYPNIVPICMKYFTTQLKRMTGNVNMIPFNFYLLSSSCLPVGLSISTLVSRLFWLFVYRLRN